MGSSTECNESARMNTTVVDLAGGADPHLVGLLLIASLVFLIFELLHPGFLLPAALGAVGFFATSVVLLRGGSQSDLGDGPEDLSAAAWLSQAHLIAVALILAGLIILIAGLFSYRTRRKDRADLETQLLGQTGRVMTLNGETSLSGMLTVCGETWKFSSDQPVRIGGDVTVIEQKNLALKVTPINHGIRIKSK